MACKNIFCISGLGADHRIFANLSIPPEYRLIHLPWIRPEKNETLASYARRMVRDVSDEEPIFMGVSFGGMLSVEIARLMPVSKIILISSIKSRNEKPFYFKAAARLRLNKVLPLKPYRFLETLENYNLGIKSEEEKALAREYRRNIDLHFSDWAIESIIHWQNETYPPDIVHIHGSQDHIFPLRYVKPTHTILGGGHMMVMNRAPEISDIITKVLAEQAVL